MLAEIKGEPGYTFNPYGFITDEAGAIIDGIRDVYGEAGVLKTFTCQFHFRQGVERQLRRMPNGLDDIKQEFEMLAMQMLSVNKTQTRTTGSSGTFYWELVAMVVCKKVQFIPCI